MHAWICMIKCVIQYKNENENDLSIKINEFVEENRREN